MERSLTFFRFPRVGQISSNSFKLCYYINSGFPGCRIYGKMSIGSTNFGKGNHFGATMQRASEEMSKTSSGKLNLQVKRRTTTFSDSDKFFDGDLRVRLIKILI